MSTKHFFNTTGPCNPSKHYMISPHERLLGDQLDPDVMLATDLGLIKWELDEGVSWEVVGNVKVLGC